MGSKDRSSSVVVEKTQVFLVKPSKPITPNVTLSLSTIDNDPHIELPVRTIFVFAPKPYLEKQANHDPVSLLRLALSNTLVYYYPFAGKLHRRSEDNRLELNCKVGDGVPFISATASCTLSSLNYLDNGDHFDVACQLVPCYDPVKGCDQGYDPLALQVTTFACGGISIGVAQSHSLVDGVGGAQFFQALNEMASGKFQQPSVIPVWDRHRLTCDNIHFDGKLGTVVQNLKLADMEKVCSFPDTPKEEMVREILNITSENITKLKKIAMGDVQASNIENENNFLFTTLEVLAAYVWRAQCRALKLGTDKTTTLGIAVSIRNIIEPPLPDGYYGNAFVLAYVTLTIKELIEMPISRLLRLIKDAKSAALDKRYVSKNLRAMEETLKLEIEYVEFPREVSMMLTDWRHIGLQLDIYGDSVNPVPLVPLTMSCVCIMLPPSKTVPGMNGGLRLLITLPRDAMTKFKEELDDVYILYDSLHVR